MEEQNIQFETKLNDHGRPVQTMYFLNDNGQHTRDFYMTPDEAVRQLQENFDFRSGHSYLITYLTNYQWRSGQPFTYIARRTNLSDHVYNIDRELELYGSQGIDDEDLHIYGIHVRQVG